MRKGWFAAATALCLAACGEEAGPLGPQTEAGPRAEAIVTINGVSLLKAGPEGGASLRAAKLGKQRKSVTFDRRPINKNGGELEVDGASLHVPRGALDRTVHITMETGDTRADGLWSYEFGPHGTEFQKSATLTIEVDIRDLVALGIDASRLSVAYVSDPDHADWQVLGGRYDPVTQTITVPIDHFSRYALCIE